MTTDTTRRDTFARLAQTEFDLLIIGGGITGAGIARDAAKRGLSVALVEKSDFGSGTSSKSSKLIHGGLRYLQQAEFGLVFEAVSERTLLLRLAPHLVRPLSFLVPTYKRQYPGLFTLDCGLWLYDALSRFAAPSRHKTYRSRALLTLEPTLSPVDLSGGIVYYDSMTDDARLTLENIIDARAHGAVVASYTQVIDLLREGDGAAPATARILGVRVRDVLPQPGVPAPSPVSVRARVVINATGPWSDDILGLAAPGGQPLLRPTKGVHIVVDAARLPVHHAVVLQSPDDSRVLFAIPWYDTDGEIGAGARTVVGTTDTDYSGDPDRVAADESDIAYLLRTINHYFPTVALTPEDVLATWAGLRPLVAPQADGLHASSVSREHRLIERTGLITIAGGKLTTYRRMAAQVVDAALGQLGKSARELPCTTGDAPLPGAVGLVDKAEVRPRARKERSAAAVQALITRLAEAAPAGLLDESMALHLSRTYGARALPLAQRLREDPTGAQRLDPELPYLMAEVDLAVTEEEALRLDDVLSRRLPLLLRSRDQGLSCAPKVAARMARMLAWDPARQEAELQSYREVVALSRQFHRLSGRPARATESAAEDALRRAVAT